MRIYCLRNRFLVCALWTNGMLLIGWLATQQTWGMYLSYGNKLTHGIPMRNFEERFVFNHVWLPVIWWHNRMRPWLRGS